MLKSNAIGRRFPILICKSAHLTPAFTNANLLFMPIPHKVAELVERFQANPAQYKAATFNETELRREFLDPFFSALGWDVENNRGLSVARRDVSHEFGIKVEGDDGEKKNRAPDYAFRIGETDDKPVFFRRSQKAFCSRQAERPRRVSGAPIRVERQIAILRFDRF